MTAICVVEMRIEFFTYLFTTLLPIIGEGVRVMQLEERRLLIVVDGHDTQLLDLLHLLEIQLVNLRLPLQRRQRQEVVQEVLVEILDGVLEPLPLGFVHRGLLGVPPEFDHALPHPSREAPAGMEDILKVGLDRGVRAVGIYRGDAADDGQQPRRAHLHALGGDLDEFVQPSVSPLVEPEQPVLLSHPAAVGAVLILEARLLDHDVHRERPSKRLALIDQPVFQLCLELAIRQVNSALLHEDDAREQLGWRRLPLADSVLQRPDEPGLTILKVTQELADGHEAHPTHARLDQPQHLPAQHLLGEGRLLPQPHVVELVGCAGLAALEGPNRVGRSPALEARLCLQRRLGVRIDLRLVYLTQETEELRI